MILKKKIGEEIVEEWKILMSGPKKKILMNGKKMLGGDRKGI